MYERVSVQYPSQGLRRDEIDSEFWNSRRFREMNIPHHGSDVILRTQHDRVLSWYSEVTVVSWKTQQPGQNNTCPMEMNPGGSLFCISHMLFAKKLSTAVLCLKAGNCPAKFCCAQSVISSQWCFFVLAVRNEDRESDAMLAEKWIKYAALMSFLSTWIYREISVSDSITMLFTLWSSLHLRTGAFCAECCCGCFGTTCQRWDSAHRPFGGWNAIILAISAEVMRVPPLFILTPFFWRIIRCLPTPGPAVGPGGHGGMAAMGLNYDPAA